MTPNVVRRWSNWALVIAATASVGLAIATRDTWTSAERLVRGNHLVVGYRAPEIRRVTLSVSGEKLVLVRTRDEAGMGADEALDRQLEGVVERTAFERPRWEFVQPYQGEAEEAAVDALLRAIEFAPFVRKVDDATLDRRAAGLDAPVQSIELEMGEGRTRLHVGATAPTPPGARYVEIGGEGTANKGVYVVSEATVKELMVRPDAFRVRQVVPYGATSLEQVTLRSAAKEVVIRAAEQGDWRLVKDGRGVRLDRDAVQRLFAALSRSRAEHFVSDVTKLAAGDAEIEATFVPKAKDRKPLRVRFGGVCPSDPSLSLAVVETPVLTAACTVPLHLDTFLTRLPELVDHRLYGLHLDAVEELRIESGERRLELARRQDGWAMRSPEAGVVERDVGDAFVQSVLDAQGELTVRPNVALTQLATLTLFEAKADERNEQSQVVEVFTATASDTEAPLLAYRRSDDAWLTLTAKHRSLFVPNVLLLKATQLLSLDVEQVPVVRTETSRWVQAFEYAGQPTGCTMSAPVGYQADNALCLDIIDEIRVLRAKRWVAETDDGAFGLGAPLLRVTFTTRDKVRRTTAAAQPAQQDHAGHDHAGHEPLATATPDALRPTGGAGERTLLVGGRSPDGAYFARLSPDPAVFTLRPSVVEALSTLVVDRAPFLVDAQDVESLVVRSSAGEVRLRRLGDELIGADVADAVALVDAISMVRPEAAVDLLKVGGVAAAPETYGFAKPLLDVAVTRRGDEGGQEFRWVVGRGDVYRNIGIYYAMPVTSGPSAVFVLPREVVQRILDAL